MAVEEPLIELAHGRDLGRVVPVPGARMARMVGVEPILTARARRHQTLTPSDQDAEPVRSGQPSLKLDPSGPDHNHLTPCVPMKAARHLGATV
jgi:hypothetical protein